jgi:hypothetical protein
MQFIVKIKGKEKYLKDGGFETDNIDEALVHNSFEDAKEEISSADNPFEYSIVRVIIKEQYCSF